MRSFGPISQGRSVGERAEIGKFFRRISFSVASKSSIQSFLDCAQCPTIQPRIRLPGYKSSIRCFSSTLSNTSRKTSRSWDNNLLWVKFLSLLHPSRMRLYRCRWIVFVSFNSLEEEEVEVVVALVEVEAGVALLLAVWSVLAWLFFIRSLSVEGRNALPIPVLQLLHGFRRGKAENVCLVVPME